jgi:hypothetical protein
LRGEKLTRVGNAHPSSCGKCSLTAFVRFADFLFCFLEILVSNI